MGWDSTFHFKYIKKVGPPFRVQQVPGVGGVSYNPCSGPEQDRWWFCLYPEGLFSQRKRARIKLPTYIYRYISKEKYYLNFHLCLLFYCCLIKKILYHFHIYIYIYTHTHTHTHTHPHNAHTHIWFWNLKIRLGCLNLRKTRWQINGLGKTSL